MTTPFLCVVDASVAVKLYLAQPLAAEAATLFWIAGRPRECVSRSRPVLRRVREHLLKNMQRGLATALHATGYLASLKALPLQRTPTFDLADEALTLALSHSATAYDACYVALAKQRGVPLITADQKLVQKLNASGLALIWLGAWRPPMPTP